MPKKFCVTGTCIPEKNYMVDISKRIDTIMHDYIENGQYFTINRARQYGKTTTLYLLERRLQKEYLDYYREDKGYLLSFNFNKKKKTGIQELNYNGKKILEVVV